jgi:SAM-dependent methyltransferase
MTTGDFKETSRSVWEAMAGGWSARHAYFEEVSGVVTERLLERLAPAPGQTILDVAAGSGIVGFSAASLVGPEGRVIVSDFAPAMVEAAARRADELGLTGVECRVLDAEALELADDAVDGVTCRWGYMLMGDPARALAETRRVLRPGGRFACAVFAGPGENPFAALPSRVLADRGHMAPPDSDAPGILALGDRNRLDALVRGAGFSDPAIEDVPFTWRFASADDYWAFLADAAGAIAMVLGRLDEGERKAVRAELEPLLAPFSATGGIELPSVSLVVSAQ